MAQFEILPYRWTAKVEVAVLHANIVTTISVVLDSEWWCETLTDDVQF